MVESRTGMWLKKNRNLEFNDFEMFTTGVVPKLIVCSLVFFEKAAVFSINISKNVKLSNNQIYL